MSSTSAPANALQPRKKRNLGFDLFRFWGVFCIFIGHNYNKAIGAAHSRVTNPNFAVMNAQTWWQNFIYPSLWMDLVLTGVPLFIMISGYHTIGRKPRATDWVDTKKTFVKYLVFWLKWLLVGGILLVLFPAVFDAGWPGNPRLNFSSVGEVIEMILENLIGTSSGKGFHALNTINWTTIGLAWAAILAFIMRPIFHQADIKAVRTITFIAVFMCLAVPTIRDVGTYFLVAHPDSLVATFMSNFSILDTTGFSQGAGNWNNFWFPMLMLGGWYAVDEKVHNRVRSWSWGKIAAICVPMVVLFVIIGFYSGLISNYADVTGTPATIYWRIGWLPASASWFIIVTGQDI